MENSLFLGVPILKHIRVGLDFWSCNTPCIILIFRVVLKGKNQLSFSQLNMVCMKFMVIRKVSQIGILAGSYFY